MALDADLLRGSFDLVVTRQPDLVTRFYDRLFERHPAARGLFAREPRDVQERMLAEALAAVLDHLEDAAWLEANLASLGVKHVEYGVTPEMYGWVGDCLLATLAEAGGGDWTDRHHAAWRDAYGAVTALMLRPSPVQ